MTNNSVELRKPISTYVPLSILLVIAALYCFFASRAFTDSYLWMDEAGQFFMSKGSFHYADKLTPEGSLYDVMYYNRYHNLDPGGFSILLRWWSCVSNHYTWLRLFPLLFYTVCLVLSYTFAKKVTGSTFKALVVTSIFLIHPAFAINSCEVRGYSMEMLGVILSLFLLYKYKDNWSRKNLVILSVALAIFMTSRYSFILYTGSLGLYILIDMTIRKGVKSAFIDFLPAAIIMFLVFGAIYFLSFRYQLRAEGVNHVQTMYLGKSLKAFVSPICIRAYLIFGILAFEFKNKSEKSEMMIIAAIASILFMLASLLNLYPVDERRAMSLTVLQCFALCVWLMNKLNQSWHINAALGVVVIASIGVVMIWPKLTKNRIIAIEEYENFKEVLKDATPETVFAVCKYYDAPIKYSIEAGELKGKVSESFYKNNILIDGDGERRKNIIANKDKIDYFYYKDTYAKKLNEIVPLKKVKRGIYVRKN